MAHLNRLEAVLAKQNKSGKWLAGQFGKYTCTISKWCKKIVSAKFEGTGADCAVPECESGLYDERAKGLMRNWIQHAAITLM